TFHTADGALRALLQPGFRLDLLRSFDRSRVRVHFNLRWRSLRCLWRRRRRWRWWWWWWSGSNKRHHRWRRRQHVVRHPRNDDDRTDDDCVHEDRQGDGVPTPAAHLNRWVYDIAEHVTCHSVSPLSPCSLGFGSSGFVFPGSASLGSLSPAPALCEPERS